MQVAHLPPKLLALMEQVSVVPRHSVAGARAGPSDPAMIEHSLLTHSLELLCLMLADQRLTFLLEMLSVSLFIRELS